MTNGINAFKDLQKQIAEIQKIIKESKIPLKTWKMAIEIFLLFEEELQLDD